MILALLFCFAVFPRIGDSTSGLDPDGYGHLGRVLYTTGKFQSIEKAPLYPAFLAAAGWISGGYRTWALQSAQCLLSALGVIVWFAVFRRALPTAGMARWAGLACAVFPLTIWYIPRFWTEILLTVCLAFYSLALIRLLQAPTLRGAALCGATVGALALTKGIALVFLPLTLAVMWPVLRTYNRRSQFLRCGAVFLGMALVILAPWIWRSWRLSGTLLPVHAEGGYNFYLGSGFARHWLDAPLSYVRLKDLTEIDMTADFPHGLPADAPERDRVMLGVALRELAAHPLRLVRKLLFGAAAFWFLAADAPKSLLTAAVQVPTALLAALGALRALRRPSWAWTLLVPIIGIWGVSALVFAFGRLSATIMPAVIGLAVYAVLGGQPFKQKEPGVPAL